MRLARGLQLAFPQRPYLGYRILEEADHDGHGVGVAGEATCTATTHSGGHTGRPGRGLADSRPKSALGRV